MTTRNMLIAEEPTVFVVDDDEALLDALRCMLQTCRLRTETFHSAESFLRQANLACHGCLLLDLRMPGMSGAQLQQQLYERGVALPIVFLTGHGTIPEAVRAMQLGAVEFLEKPYRPQTLLAAIQEALQRSERQRQRQADRESLTAVLASLSAEERQVFVLLAAGKTNREIAQILDVSLRTVQFRRASLMKALGAATRSELMHWFYLYRMSDQ